MRIPRFFSLLPQSLERQFVLALSALALLVASGSLIGVYALRGSAQEIRKLSEERLARMQDAQEALRLAALVEHGMLEMLNAGSLDHINGHYLEVQKQLDQIEQLVARLGTAGDRTSILTLHQSEQNFRNMVHVVARLRQEMLQADSRFAAALQARTAALEDAADDAGLALAMVYFRLSEADSDTGIAALRQRFLQQARQARRLPPAVRSDLPPHRAGDADAAPADDVFSQRLALIGQRSKLARFRVQLEQQKLDLLASAQAVSAHYADAYRAEVRHLADTSNSRQYLVLGFLGASLILAWMLSKYLLGKHVLARLDQVSRYLRQERPEDAQPSVPVQGNDEIGAMARAVENLLKDRQRLYETNQELEEFSYSVSHDLRTPLRAIDGFSKILLEDYAAELDGDGKRMLNLVRDNTARMGQLIDAILQYVRIGRLHPLLAEIDMEQLARDAAEDLRPLMAEGKYELEIGPLPPAVGDRAMLRQVFVSLLSNAVKFSRSNPAPKIQVGAEAGAGQTAYFVKDNGVGFDMQYVGKLFKVFERVHPTGEFQGSAVGLALVRRIVERHGGSVSAEGQAGAGATFRFTLPNRKN